MAESASERTEKATPQRLRKARQRGEVAISRDLTSAAVLVAGAAVLLGWFPELVRRIGRVAVLCFSRVGGAPTTAEIMDVLRTALWEAGVAVAPIFVVATALALLVPFLQVGPLLTFTPLLPKLERLDPLRGLKNRLFSLRSWVELLKAGLLVTAAGLLCWSAVRAALPDLVRLSACDVRATLYVTAALLRTCLWRILACFVALAVADFFYQRWQYRREQRMTRDEVRREYKEEEGDPHVKVVRRQLHEELAMNNMLEQIRHQADVVVKNPTHLACALFYDPREGGTPPKLIGKGQGWLAERIRQIAREEGIPVVRNVPLARALYELEVDDRIPRELYEAVVEVLRWAEEIAAARGESPRWKQRA